MNLSGLTPKPAKDLSDLSAEQLEQYRAALIYDCKLLEEARQRERETTDRYFWKMKQRREAYAEELEGQIKLLEKELKRLAAKKAAIQLS